ncbi:hypothetical protein ACFXPY_26390 [Streptomyces sp. NPDC059153]|uniref:hypothetical protein n=1 Tax=Streptomyces sp. NPDC059153 TaxID=3346743 RepID=UPI0036BA714A
MLRCRASTLQSIQPSKSIEARFGTSRARAVDALPATRTEAEELRSVGKGRRSPFSAHPRAGLDYQRARTLQALGHGRQALSALRDAARRRTPARRRPYALTQARLAGLPLDAGHLDEACAHVHLTLGHYLQLHSAQAESPSRTSPTGCASSPVRGRRRRRCSGHAG